MKKGQSLMKTDQISNIWENLMDWTQVYGLLIKKRSDFFWTNSKFVLKGDTKV